MENEIPSKRQLEILQMMDEGLSRKMIAEKTGILIGTVNTQLNLIYKMTGTHSITGCLHVARINGWLRYKKENDDHAD